MDNAGNQFLELSITRVTGDGRESAETDVVVREQQLRIVVNDQELAVASILPGMEREFAYGLLLASGVIEAAAEVRSWVFDDKRGIAFIDVARELPVADAATPPVLLGTACGSQPLAVSSMKLNPITSRTKVPAGAILSAAESLRQESVLFRDTGGVHSAALCRNDGSMLFRADDIGRHNACDKVIGACLLEKGVDPAACFMICTGRLSSEMVTKAWRFGLPVIASRSAATSRAIEIAGHAAISLAGFVRAGRMNIYCGAQRILEEL
jgi:FdhD protein